MHQNHGIGYAEYNQCLHTRLQVEEDREKNHRESLQLIDQLQRQVHG
ncbi:hypothetical protein BCL52_0921 [Salisediminibacterium halotolerans]|uniref:Uncharacterized protein n=2 Tax=Salisediminibacterium halotolerans TaxID=517425 RepID=A0A1H9VNX0_9BACI|nr:hypothetical protein [Salisediminibacterium halotolerans]RLJ75409.1 hypothetical protein BCL39_0923 [Actinophytocola xinjiangensis]RPE89263.1 hypothetical protein EDD67_0036 [Salisediminibacterium halotolerans]TWG36022.1 hypothetical protein BCL52_0921 [Salisediminibacterium halotolerans]SES23027.1 hypothetical protein SAMN05444126_12223 [Salisediminibacterium haloalkalitolerans]